jgi:hypothetical protein
MLDDFTTTTHHVLRQLIFELCLIILSTHLNEVRLFNGQLELAGSLDQVVEDPVCNLVGLWLIFINHYPLTLAEMNSFTDRQLPQRLLIAADQLVAIEDLWSTKHSSFHAEWLCLNDQVPIFHGLLLRKFFDHLHDLLHLLARKDSCFCKGVPHASRLTHTVWNTIDQTEFSGQRKVLVSNFDLEQRLLGSGDLFLIALIKVLCH